MSLPFSNSSPLLGLRVNERELAAGLSETPGYRYSQVVGNELFVAGQVPLDGDGVLVGADVSAQAKKCLENLGLVIDVAGFDRSDVRRITIHVVGSRKDLSAAWEAVRSWFGGEVPPATLLGSPVLGFDGQLVEVDATVVRQPR